MQSHHVYGACAWRSGGLACVTACFISRSVCLISRRQSEAGHDRVAVLIQSVALAISHVYSAIIMVQQDQTDGAVNLRS